MILFVFHFDISDKDINDEQPLNKKLMSVNCSVSQFEISGNDIINEQPLNNQYSICLNYFYIFYIFNSGKYI